MRLLLLALAASAPAVSVLAGDFRPVLQNPGMEGGGSGAPEGWHGKFGDVTVTRDTEVVHNGSASLSVQNAGTRNACAHQMLAVSPGMKLKLGGWVRSADGAKVDFAAQFFDEKFTRDEFIQVMHLEGAQDWQLAEKEITVPDTSTRMAIALYVEGVGRAWLDDVTLIVDGSAVEVKAPGPAPDPPKVPDDAKLIPTTPLPGCYAQFPKAWMVFHENNLKRARQGGIDVLFLGDSLTQGWGGAGKEQWDKDFAPLNAANFGIGGDTTGNVLWRLEHGEVDGISPRVVVLMIGVNNLWSGRNTGEEIAGGIRAVVEKLRLRIPQARVLVLGVLPIGSKADDFSRMKAAGINVHASGLDDGVMVKFVDLGPKLLDARGAQIESAYMKDSLHLTAKGYEMLAKELAPLVMEMLKQPSASPAPEAR